VKKLFEGLYISVTEKKNAKNASIGPNKFSKQYHYTPELPERLQCLLHLAAENMVMTAELMLF